MPHQRKLKKDIRCPLEYGLDVFGGRWKSRIICVLAAKQTLRYGELRSEMTDISDTVLSNSLKELIADDLVARHSYNEIPPRVEYFLGRPHTAKHLPLGRYVPPRSHGRCAAPVPAVRFRQ